MLVFRSSFSFCPLYFIHPLPPAGYSRLSQGESFGYSVVTDCPTKLGGRAKRRGCVSFPFSVFRFPFSSFFLQHLCRLNLADAVYLVAYGEKGDGCNDEDREQEVE